MEIERKFLLEDLPQGLDLGDGAPIRQGYVVASEAAEVRLRRTGETCLLTVKKGSGVSREEYEIELAAGQFEQLWPATEDRRVEKRRYRVTVEGGVAELDVYGGNLEGLITAEVEFDDLEAATRFEAPAWFGPEVTDDDRWANRNLATHGRPLD